MFLTSDKSHQALDMNIGRVLEMFLGGDISRDQALEHLTSFYNTADECTSPTQLRAYIDAQLDDARGRTDKVRADLVHAAVMAHEGHDLTGHILDRLQ